MKSHLPTLPKVPGAENYLPRGESMLDKLATEHRFLDAMCADVADAPSRDQAQVLVAVLCRHLSVERQYFYPVIGSVPPDDLLSLAYAFSRAQLGSMAWHRALAALTTAVRSHALECESMYASMRASLSQTDLVRLGNRVDMALESAPSRPHPRAPKLAPWNKVTDPVLGAVDKIHDLVTRRATYPPPVHVAAGKRLRTRHIAITQS
jgi:hypothetical protein